MIIGIIHLEFTLRELLIHMQMYIRKYNCEGLYITFVGLQRRVALWRRVAL